MHKGTHRLQLFHIICRPDVTERTDPRHCRIKLRGHLLQGNAERCVLCAIGERNFRINSAIEKQCDAELPGDHLQCISPRIA